MFCFPNVSWEPYWDNTDSSGYYNIPPFEGSLRSQRDGYLARVKLWLPACRRLLFPLLHACNKGNRRRLHAGKVMAEELRSRAENGEETL